MAAKNPSHVTTGKRASKKGPAASRTKSAPSSTGAAPAPDPRAKLKKNPAATRSSAAKLTSFLQAAVKGAQLNLASDSTLAKLYELEVAIHFMRKFRDSDSENRIELAGHFQDPAGAVAGAGDPDAGKGKTVTVVLPGKPELPQPARYTFFKLRHSTGVDESLWLSVRFQTRASVESKADLAGISEKALFAHVTELDVGVYRQDLVAGEPPSYELLSLAASCKLTECSRADVSNAEFLRSVTATRTGCPPAMSRAAWAMPDQVPADPAIPVYLASASATLARWKQPLDAVGIYCRQVTL